MYFGYIPENLHLFLHRNKFQVTGILDTYYVAETCCSIAIGSDATEIRLFGIEGDGICSLLLEKDSHYNGKDPDVDMQPNTVADAFLIMRCLCMFGMLTRICVEKK